MKFKITASYMVYLEAEVEAENADAAWMLAEKMEGGDFLEAGIGDWEVMSAEEMPE